MWANKCTTFKRFGEASSRSLTAEISDGLSLCTKGRTAKEYVRELVRNVT